MVLKFVLSTLALLAISIVLSEKQLYLRRNTKKFNSPPNVKNNYAKTNNKKPDIYFANESFLMHTYLEYFSKKQTEKSSLKKSKNKYLDKKHSIRSIINWPKN